MTPSTYCAACEKDHDTGSYLHVVNPGSEREKTYRHPTELDYFRCLYRRGLLSQEDVAKAYHVTRARAAFLLEGGNPYDLVR